MTCQSDAVRIDDVGDGGVLVAVPIDAHRRVRGRHDPAVLRADDAVDPRRRRHAAGVVRHHRAQVRAAVDAFARLRVLLEVVVVEEGREGVQVRRLQCLRISVDDLARVDVGHRGFLLDQ